MDKSLIKLLVVIVVVILAMVLAKYITNNMCSINSIKNKAEKIGAYEPHIHPDTGGYDITRAILEEKMSEITKSIANPEVEMKHMVVNSSLSNNDQIIGGGSIRHWTTYPTWKAMNQDKKATKEYYEALYKVMSTIPDDWSVLRKECEPMVGDDREWVGLINIVEGAPTVIHKVPSPSKVGDVSSGDAAAEVPPEVIKEVTQKPAYFMFHTHPSSVPNSHIVSIHDIMVSLCESYYGHYAANIMVSKDAIVLYGMYKEPLDRIRSSQNPPLEFSKYCLDVYSTLVGLRSRGHSYSIQKFTEILAEFGIFYVVIPGDGYANKYYNMVYSVPQENHIGMYESLLAAISAEAKST